MAWYNRSGTGISSLRLLHLRNYKLGEGREQLVDGPTNPGPSPSAHTPSRHVIQHAEVPTASQPGRNAIVWGEAEAAFWEAWWVRVREVCRVPSGFACAACVLSVQVERFTGSADTWSARSGGVAPPIEGRERLCAGHASPMYHVTSSVVSSSSFSF